MGGGGVCVLVGTKVCWTVNFSGRVLVTSKREGLNLGLIEIENES